MTKNKVTFEIDAKIKELSSKLDKASKKFDSVGKKAGLAFAGLSASIVGLSTRFGKFETKVTNVNTLLSGKELSRYGDTIKKEVLGAVKDFGFSLASAGDAMFDTVSALGANERAFKTYTEAQRLAIGGNTDISISVDGLTTVLNSYTKQTLTAKRASEIFFAAQKKGKTTVGAFASNIGKVAPLADALGISFEKTSAALSKLTLSLGTEEGVTALKGLLSALVRNRKELEAQGIAITDNNGNFRDFGKIMIDLQKKTKGNAVALQDLLRDQRAVAGATGLLGDSLEGYNKILEDVMNNTEDLNEAVKKQQKTFTFAFNRFKGVMTSLSIVLGEQLAPAVLKVTNLLERMGNFIIAHPGFAKFIAFATTSTTLIVGLTAVVAFSVSKFILLGSVILKIIGLIKKLSIVILANPIGLVITAITLAVVALGVAFLKVKKRVGTFGKATLLIFNTIMIAVKKTQISFSNFITKLLNGYNKVAKVVPILKEINVEQRNHAKILQEINDLQNKNIELLKFKPSPGPKTDKPRTFADILANVQIPDIGDTFSNAGKDAGEDFTNALTGALKSDSDIFVAIGEVFKNKLIEGIGSILFKPIGGFLSGILGGIGGFLGFAGGGDIPKIPQGDTGVFGFRPEDEFVMNARETSAVQGGDFAMVGKGILDNIKGNGGGGGTSFNFDFNGATFSGDMTDSMIEEIFTKGAEKIRTREIVFNAG